MELCVSLIRYYRTTSVSFSGFVITERAYYLAVHFLTYYTDLYFYTFLIPNTCDMDQFLEFFDIFEQGNLDSE